MKKKIKLLICDLDNTLYDWARYFVSSFYSMIDKMVEILECDKDQLIEDFKKVHQKHHDSEYPFSILETETIHNLYPHCSAKDLLQIDDLKLIIDQFNRCRENTLTLYPHVYETLVKIKNLDINLVAHTEANLFAVIYRLERLQLTSFFSKIYCKERTKTPHPNGSPKSRIFQEFPYDKVVELSRHQKKPDPNVIFEICSNFSISTEETAYVGDSMARDMLMSKQANVYSIYAKYGANQNDSLYEDLVKVTHWTTDDVKREHDLKEMSKSIIPDYTLTNDFSEILTLFSDLSEVRKGSY